MMVGNTHHQHKILNHFHSKHVDWIALLSCSLAFCIYLNTLNAGFVYDDSRAILTNKDVLQQETSWKDIWKDDFWGTPLTHSGSHKSFRPLTILSFRVNRHFSGFNPWAYHLTNILLHTFTTYLFVRVARVVFALSDLSHLNPDNYWTCNQSFALLVSALLFASHPIHTEAVAGVVGRADVGATAFALSSFLAYANHVKHRNKRHSYFDHRCHLNSSSSSKQIDTTVRHLNTISTSFPTHQFHFVSLAYFAICILFATAAMLSKEHGVMILFVCAVYDVILSVIRCRRYQSRITSFRNLECCASVILLGLSFVALFHVRLSVMGGLSPPTFAKADNPTAHHPNFWVRTLTFLFLPVFNFSLLIYPHPLSYDWSMDAVQKIERLSDPRNLLTFLFYFTLLRRIYLCAMKINACLKSDGDNQSAKASPIRIACKICRCSIGSYRHNNNNSIIIPNESDDCINKNSAHSSLQTNSTPSKITPRISSITGSPKTSNGSVHHNGNSSSNGGNHHPHQHQHHSSRSSSTSTSPNRQTFPLWHCSSGSLENGALLLQIAFLVLPFLPACNIFLYVGFVVAERVLYFPSVGFCLLIGHGFSQLCIRTERQRRGGSFLKALLVAAFLASIVMMSLGTIRRNDDWKDEGRLYRAGIAVNPPKSWGNLGNVLNSQGRVGEAEEAYRHALRYRPNMAEVHYNLGLVLERQAKVEEALSSYRTAIHFRPQLASAYVNAGQLLTRLGRINQAMDMYRRCFNLNDDGVKDLRTHVEAKVSALLRFGKLLIEIEDAPKAAVNVYRQAVRIMPPDYEQKQSVYNAIGEALFRIGEITEAEGWFLEALKTKPDHVPAHLTYGKMLARNKTRLLEAERWFRRAKKIAPQDSSVYHHYGQFLAVQGRHAEAATAYVTAATLTPNDYDIVVGAANALRQSGNNREAEVYYEKAVALRSQEARAHMNLGAILHVNGKYHEAEQSYLMALRLKPSDDVTLLNLKKLRQLQARRNQYAMSCKNKNRGAQQIPQKPEK